MFEKVSGLHIDKVADRIAGAMVDYAYNHSEEEPHIAVEVLIGHGKCHIIAETDFNFDLDEVKSIVKRIAGDTFEVDYQEVPQDKHLNDNQKGAVRCGDNGIFKAVRTSEEEHILSDFAKHIYKNIIPSDGKYIISGDKITICQSGIDSQEMLIKAEEYFKDYDYDLIINPLGNWSADLNNDTGVTNRKLGSDMGRCATGGGLMGKDLSKADVSINVFLYLLLNKPNKLSSCLYTYEESKIQDLIDKAKLYDTIEASCNIGDVSVEILGVKVSFETITTTIGRYIRFCVGGFEKFAEWGLI